MNFYFQLIIKSWKNYENLDFSTSGLCLAFKKFFGLFSIFLAFRCLDCSKSFKFELFWSNFAIKTIFAENLAKQISVQCHPVHSTYVCTWNQLRLPFWDAPSLPISQHRLWMVPIFFRDNGITTQIMIYQLYVEVVVVFWMVIVGSLLPIERNLMMLKINSIIAPFLFFVIQPLFYLNGDVNFRNRVMNHGLWQALKRELFYSHNAVSPFATPN